MKIIYFRLKGYIQIFNGMGLDEIEIPFHQFKNKIILIQGKNGLGKSTLLDTMTFDPDGSLYYRDGYVSEKEIHVLDRGNIYIGKIISSINGNGNRNPTKAYISKNGEELNPNGNVSSYKEIFLSEFNVDPIFIQLSHISSEDKGLVDKSPVDRKRYVASMIPSLQFYNTAFKNLSKKSSIFKSHINGLSNKIYSIGDEANLRSTLASLEIQKQRIQDAIDNTRTDIGREQAKIQIIDPDSKIQDLYERIYNELEEVNFHIKKSNDILDKEYVKFNLEPHMTDFIENALSDTTKNIDIISKKIIEGETNLRNQIAEQESTIRSIELKQTKMNSLQSDFNYEQLKDTVFELRDKLSVYESDYPNIQNINMSKEEMIYIVNSINQIRDMIASIKRDNHPYIYEVAIKSIIDNENLEDVYRDTSDTILSNKNIIMQNNQLQIEIQQKLELVSILDNRPSNCKIDDCYFIKNAINLNKDSLERDLENSIKICASLDKENSGSESFLNILDSQIQIVKFIYKLLDIIEKDKSLLCKISNSEPLLDRNEFLNKLYNAYPFNELSDADKYIKYADIINDYKNNKNLLISLEADLKIYENQLSIISDIIKEIEGLTVNLNNIANEIQSKRNDIDFNNSIIEKFKQKKNDLENIISMEVKHNELLNKKSSIREQFEYIKNDIKQISASLENVNSLKSTLKSLEDQQKPIVDQISGIQYSLVTLESYNQELEMYKDKYDKVEFIKKCSSPSKGIQTLFMSIYMNKTIGLSNELLQNFFNGELSILEPIINDDEFRIPFVGESGLPVDDISFGSCAQKSMMSMILSFILLIQGSEFYNIARLDEIDTGLDTENKMIFPQVINRLMDILHIEQCIMVSHSIESETYNVDIIHLNKYGITYE